MVECAKPLLELGDDIRVNLVNHFDASGEVVWASGRYVGIRFDAALHEAVVRFSGFNPTVSENPFLHPCDRFGRRLAPQPVLSGLTGALL